MTLIAETQLEGASGMDAQAPWHAEVLRLSCFFEPVARQQWVQEDLFQRISHQPPESRSERPAQQLLTEEGPWDNGRLAIAIQPNRADLVWSGSLEAQQLAFPSVGEFSSVVDGFKDAISRALDGSLRTTIRRIAFGAVLIKATENRAGAYKALVPFLPTVQIDLESQDFAYQINRPSRICDGRVKINRLGKWAAVEGQFIQFAATAGGPMEKIPTISQFAARLELDINTMVDELQNNNKAVDGPLIAELFEHGKMLARDGDRS